MFGGLWREAEFPELFGDVLAEIQRGTGFFPMAEANENGEEGLGGVMDPFFAEFGISGAHWGVLRSLYRAEQENQGEVRLTDLGDRLIIRPPSVSGRPSWEAASGPSI